MNIKVQRLSETATLPTYGSEQAACMDLYADLKNETATLIIPPHATQKISTGLAFEPPNGYCGLIFARSGLSTKHGLRPANAVGICDCDYRSEYIVALHNDTDEPQQITHKQRIAQLIFVPYQHFELQVVNQLTDTKRGEGGFGSTGY